jgi:hypothetical protein
LPPTIRINMRNFILLHVLINVLKFEPFVNK